MGLMRHERTTQLRGLRPDRGAVTQTSSRRRKKENETFDAPAFFLPLCTNTHTHARRSELVCKRKRTHGGIICARVLCTVKGGGGASEELHSSLKDAKSGAKTPRHALELRGYLSVEQHIEQHRLSEAELTAGVEEERRKNKGVKVRRRRK